MIAKELLNPKLFCKLELELLFNSADVSSSFWPLFSLV